MHMKCRAGVPHPPIQPALQSRKVIVEPVLDTFGRYLELERRMAVKHQVFGLSLGDVKGALDRVDLGLDYGFDLRGGECWVRGGEFEVPDGGGVGVGKPGGEGVEAGEDREVVRWAGGDVGEAESGGDGEVGGEGGPVAIGGGEVGEGGEFRGREVPVCEVGEGGWDCGEDFVAGEELDAG